MGILTAVSVRSSILNLPGESTLRRDFLRLQLANKERSEALRRQQLEQQQRENEEHKRQLLAERQKRIEEQKEQRRRLEEVRAPPGPPLHLSVSSGHAGRPQRAQTTPWSFSIALVASSMHSYVLLSVCISLLNYPCRGPGISLLDFQTCLQHAS